MSETIDLQLWNLIIQHLTRDQNIEMTNTRCATNTRNLVGISPLTDLIIICIYVM